ncbi:prolyl oligopeptidase family serine peptidase [Serratia ureilytica]
MSQHFARSKDGTRVPYFQIAAKDPNRTAARRRCCMATAGLKCRCCRAISAARRRPGWSAAGVRGGQHPRRRRIRLGRHQAALKQNRHRAYEDFAAVAEDLIARKVTSAPHLGARRQQRRPVGGQYADAVSAAVRLHRLRCRCWTCSVIPSFAGASWIAEYGDPSKPEQWAYIKTFSPYHNIQAKTAYPPVLFYTATSDDRVNPAHARKWPRACRRWGISRPISTRILKAGTAPPPTSNRRRSTARW